jgi:hypothetical protein
METWEFLLQKKGDKSWLPLESPTVEILEGQYRLAARSSFANILIAIQLRYEPSAETASKPNQQKISKRVSPEGLLIVMPYTHFTPGTWQISCLKYDDSQFPNQAANPTPSTKPWMARVQFDILPVAPEIAAEWQPKADKPPILTLAKPAPTDPETQPAPYSASTELELMRRKSDQISEQLVESIFSEFSPFTDDADIASEAEITDKTDVDTTPARIIPAQLINLNQVQFLVFTGESIKIAGTAYVQGELEIVLKNPQSLEVVLSASHVLPPSERDDAIAFSYEILLPKLDQSQVMIGEVRLHPVENLSAEGYVTRQAIAITYQADDPIAEMSRAVQEVEAALEAQTISESTIESTVAKIAQPTLPTKSLEAPKLPPLLSNPGKANLPVPPIPIPGFKLPSLPTLPSLIQVQSGQPSAGDSNIAEEIAEELATELEVEQIHTSDRLNDVDDLLDMFDESSFDESVAEDLHYEFEESPVLPTKPQIVNLNSDRFLNKLQTLSQTSAMESTELESSSEIETIDSEFELEFEPEIAPEILQFNPQSEAELAEKVTDLDALDSELDQMLAQVTKFDAPKIDPMVDLPMLNRSTINSSPPAHQPTSVRATTPFPAIAAQDPIPLPILAIPEGELVSGTPILAAVRLPAIAPKLMVKLWVKDCQTRAIVDGPRWLMDFKSSGDQIVEARTQITVPLGAMEVAFEAITVEMQTLRESHKTCITRMVAPPNLVKPSPSVQKGGDFDSVWHT